MGQTQPLCDVTSQKCQKHRRSVWFQETSIPCPAFLCQYHLQGALHTAAAWDFFLKVTPCHCPAWKLLMAPHCILEETQHLRLAESGIHDSSLPCLHHLSPRPIQPHQSACYFSNSLAISCLCAFAHAVPSAWKALFFFSVPHPLRGLNVTSSEKLSLIHPGRQLLHPLYFICTTDLQLESGTSTLMICLLLSPS